MLTFEVKLSESRSKELRRIRIRTSQKAEIEMKGPKEEVSLTFGKKKKKKAWRTLWLCRA